MKVGLKFHNESIGTQVIFLLLLLLLLLVIPSGAQDMCSGITLVVFWEPDVLSGMESELALCKANTYFSLISIWPEYLGVR